LTAWAAGDKLWVRVWRPQSQALGLGGLTQFGVEHQRTGIEGLGTDTAQWLEIG